VNLLQRSFAALGLSVFAMGCASLPAPPSAKGPEGAARYYDAVNWDAAGAEATRVLQEYLRVDTINPPGNETRGAQFMHDILAKEGIPSEVLEYAPGRVKPPDPAAHHGAPGNRSAGRPYQRRILDAVTPVEPTIRPPR
jgi:hypothetical protein